MTPAWLEPPMQRLRSVFTAGRLPHAVLIHEAPGAGGEWLAYWAAQLVLCTDADKAPCGQCPACRQSARRQHPDLMNITPQGTSRQIRIEQVRELTADLALTAHQGGYKVGILSPADSMNRFAANALLKTLEEPPARTLLVLVASVPSRLPATIISRCQRVRLGTPPRAAAVEWLTATRGAANWAEVLEVLGEAPLLAAEADPGEVLETAEQVRGELEAVLAGRGDAAGTAERWAKSHCLLRLACFENWLTNRIRGLLGTASPVEEVRAGAHRRSTGPTIRETFALLDAVRQLRSSFDVPLNRSVALEALLRRLAPRRAA